MSELKPGFRLGGSRERSRASAHAYTEGLAERLEQVQGLRGGDLKALARAAPGRGSLAPPAYSKRGSGADAVQGPRGRSAACGGGARGARAGSGRGGAQRWPPIGHRSFMLLPGPSRWEQQEVLRACPGPLCVLCAPSFSKGGVNLSGSSQRAAPAAVTRSFGFTILFCRSVGGRCWYFSVPLKEYCCKKLQ